MLMPKGLGFRVSLLSSCQERQSCGDTLWAFFTDASEAQPSASEPESSCDGPTPSPAAAATALKDFPKAAAVELDLLLSRRLQSPVLDCREGKEANPEAKIALQGAKECLKK